MSRIILERRISAIPLSPKGGSLLAEPIMSIASELAKSVREELQTETRYKRRAKTADSGTRMLYLHIAQEEHNHAVEFKRRLEKLGY